MSETSSTNLKESAPKPDFARRIKLLAVSIIAGVIVLSAGWFGVARTIEGRVQTVLTDAKVECPDLRAFGYPFRMGISCSKVSTPIEGGRFEASNLRTAAQVYRPSLIIAELDSPSVSLVSGQTYKLEKGAPRASIRVDGILPARVSVDVKAPEISGFPAGISAADVQVHFRKGPENKLDFAVSGIDIKAGAAPVAQIAIDASLSGTSRIEAALAAGGGNLDQALRTALRGSEGEIRALQLQFAGATENTLNVSGPFTIGNDGFLTGEIRISVTDGAAFASALTVFTSALGVDVTPMTNILASTGAAKTDITITIKNGAASIGFIPLGQLPPL
jgi:hypothetical protein